MNWAALSKDQKQKVTLGVMMVVTSVFLVSNLLLKPAKEARTTAEITMKELEPKVRVADGYMKGDEASKRVIRQAAQRIQALAEAHIPPDKDTFGWCAAWLYKIREDLGIPMDITLSPVPRYSRLREGQPYHKHRKEIHAWVPYTLHVEAVASFEQTRVLLQAIMDHNPYVNIGEITITPREGSPELHKVSLDVEWPNWRAASDRALIAKEAKP